MTIFLLLIPVLAMISSLYFYKFNGKRDFLKLDSIQFFYAFVLVPLIFIWAKSFIYFLLKNEIDTSLSQGDIFLFDTLFSVIFLYIFAFVVIHALTKTLSLKVSKDPLYDVFHHSEFFHLWLSHLAIFSGGMILTTLVAVFNSFFPLAIYMNKLTFYFFIFMGVFCGGVVFIWTWMSNPKQEKANFMRLVKLLFGVCFLIHVILYFILDPKFNSQHLAYWWSFFVFATTVACSLFAYKSEKAQTIFERISHRFKHKKWDFRKQLFR